MKHKASNMHVNASNILTKPSTSLKFYHITLLGKSLRNVQEHKIQRVEKLIDKVYMIAILCSIDLHLQCNPQQLLCISNFQPVAVKLEAFCYVSTYSQMRTNTNWSSLQFLINQCSMHRQSCWPGYTPCHITTIHSLTYLCNYYTQVWINMAQAMGERWWRELDPK